MKTLLIFLFCILTVSTVHDERKRGGKYISLFNVITFNNDQCTSTMTTGATTAGTTMGATAPNRLGICYSADECTRRTGVARGNCASGFGVCCVFTVTNAADVRENCTYIQSANFPGAITSMAAIMNSNIIRKCSNDVCSFRLDFQAFQLGQVVNEVNSCNAATGSLTIQTGGTTTTNLPTICGTNTRQHIYIPVGPNAGDTATLMFNVPANSANNMWDIKVTQVRCGRNTPPDGCFQYFTEASGTITTFNYDSTAAASTHLSNQNYAACIRPLAGTCCVRYTACTANPESFSINQMAIANAGLVDTECNADFIELSGGTAACVPGTTGLTNRICGTLFTTIPGQVMAIIPGGAGAPVMVTVPQNAISICDCSRPFEIRFRTDNLADATAMRSRGVCLNYAQVPCM